MGHAGEPFLLTLPAPSTRSAVIARPSWYLRVDGALKVTVETAIPVGRRCGSSTAGCVAAVRAVADLLGVSWSEEAAARLVRRAGLASDATMEAVTAGDAIVVGRATLRSGAIHQRCRPHGEWEALTAQARANSGTAAGVIWQSC